MTDPVRFNNPAQTDPTPPTLPPHINADYLPRPLGNRIPTLVPTWYHNTVNNFQQSIQRPLTPDEQSAVAYHVYYGARTVSFGAPMSFAAGVGRAMWTWKDMRFPIFGKWRKEDGSGVWDGQRLRIFGREILGSVPRAMKAALLHSIRVPAYLLVGYLLVDPAIAAWGEVQGKEGMVRDPRMKDVVLVLGQKLREERERKKVEMAEGQRREDGRMEKSKETRKGAGASTGEDEGGATGADGRSEGMVFGIGGDGEGGGAEPRREPNMKAQQEVRRAAANERAWKARTQQRQPEGFADETSDDAAFPIGSAWERARENRSSGFSDKSFDGDDNDDASPTAASGINGKFDSDGGSAWDKVRLGAASGSSSSSNFPDARGFGVRGGREQETGGNDFAFSGEEAERGAAREEAQRSFDEMLEKERRLGDAGDDEEGRGGRRW